MHKCNGVTYNIIRESDNLLLNISSAVSFININKNGNIYAYSHFFITLFWDKNFVICESDSIDNFSNKSIWK